MRSRVDGNPEEGGWDMIPENAENAEGEYKSRDCFDYFIRICILSVHLRHMYDIKTSWKKNLMI